MGFEIEGKLHKKFDTEKKTESFQVRNFVILINDSGYENYIKFQLTQDRCDLIESVSEGTKIKVHFDLRGREWEGKYFTNLNAWKLETADDVAPDEQWPEPDDEVFFEDEQREDKNQADEELDDIPF